MVVVAERTDDVIAACMYKVGSAGNIRSTTLRAFTAEAMQQIVAKVPWCFAGPPIAITESRDAISESPHTHAAATAGEACQKRCQVVTSSPGPDGR